jgi:hypothetical protein
MCSRILARRINLFGSKCQESFFLVWQSKQNELALLGRAWAGSFPITLPGVECTSAPPGDTNDLRLTAISTMGGFEI